MRGRGTNRGPLLGFPPGKGTPAQLAHVGRNDPFHNCGWEGGVWRQVLGWEVSCATGLCPPSLDSSGWRGWEEGLQLPENIICVLAAPSWHSHEEEDGEGSQQFWVGKGWQISPQVLPNFHASIFPVLALPMGITRMCWHTQAELGHTRTPSAAARW